MAATLAVFVAVQVFMPYVVRPHLMTPERTDVALDSMGVGTAGTEGGPPASKSDWSATNIVLSGDGDDAHVQVGLARDGAWVVSDLARVRDSGGRTVGGSEGCAAREIDPLNCFAESDLHVEVAYHPADRYWAFQWIETAIFVALAGLLTGFCTWWLRRRLT